MAARKTWGQLSRATRDRWAKSAAADYGLSRRSAREMYNRGTYSPGAKAPERRVPRKVMREEGIQSLKDKLLSKRRDLVESTWRNSPAALARYERRLDEMPHAVLRAIAAADFDLQEAAHYQASDMEAGNVPKKYRVCFYRNDEGEWVNSSWYR